MDMASFDSTHRFNPAQGRLGRSQQSKALLVSKEPFQGGVIALNKVVSPLLVDVPDTVKMGIIVVNDLTDSPPI